ncbi:LamG-like jellyroll fold domain-containing protein [Micromonospora chalcea]|uniref:LamG-like jellyroll fold domain-containing protein n=1 Tax=Micromonospora chalcea TaxID=1874 RepID=UPI001B6F6FBA|nr:LamG domain-containing protein [Micromonospora sp. C41]
MTMAHARIAQGATLAILATLLSVVTSPPTAAHAADCPSGVVAESEPAAETEAAAQRLAELCDKPVEVLAEADETTKVVALPSGDFSMETYLEPQRVERNDRWIALDTNLERGADGRFRPRAAADVSFSTGGTGPLATYREGGADFTLTWPAPLPAGVVREDSVTYPEVHPGVDLVVRAVPGGFSHVLVVKNAEAAANPEVRETAYVIGGSATVTETNDEIVIKGPAGVIAGAPKAMAWDSTRQVRDPQTAALRREDPEGLAPPRVAEPSTAEAPSEFARRSDLDVRVAGKRLTVSVDEDLLSAQSTFPVYIDPTYSKYYAKWIPVNDSRPDTKWVSGDAWPREVIRIGSNYDNYGDVWRAHMQFDISALRGKRVINTPSVDAYLTHSAWCAGESLALWQTNAIDGNTPTWNGMKGKWLHGKAIHTKTVKVNSGCSGQKPAWVKFNAGGVKTHVQRHADENYSTITFGLRVPTESGGHWVKAERGKIKLVVEYQSKPTSPVPVRTAPGGNCAASPGPWINDSTPALYATATDADNSVRLVFDVNGPTAPADYTSAAVASGKEATWTTPVLADGSYNWRVYATDGTDKTGWSKTCYFRQDHTPPTLPVIARKAGTPTPELGKPVTLTFSSTDALSGVERFDYGIGVDVKSSNVTASAGKAEVTFTADSGLTQIYVWARDNALNSSSRAIYNIFTGRVTPVEPMAVWRMTSNLRDDSGTIDDEGNTSEASTAKDLRWTVSGTPTYSADRLNHGSTALDLTGTGCATTIPVVRSDAAFTATAWVKLTSKAAGSNRTVLAVAGTNAPAFALSYDQASDRWQTAITNADSATGTSTIARGTTSPPLNGWQHVATTVDPVGKTMRLYVDGAVQATTAIGALPWRGTARTLVGCGGTAGVINEHLIGAVDDVAMWSGLLSDAQIAAARDELPAGVAAAWKLRGTGDDASNHGHTLTVPTPATPPTPEPTPEPEVTDDPAPDPGPGGGPTPPPGEEPTPEPTETGDPNEPDPTGSPEVPEETEEPSPDPSEEPTPEPTPAPTVPMEWTDDAYGRPGSAWYVSGDRCATTQHSVIRSDESFTLAVWARLDDPSAMNQTIIGTDGNRVSGLFLGARTNAAGVPFWALMMKASDSETSTSEWAGGSTDAFAATVGKWTHLTATYNATTKTMSLFVNGAKAASVVRSTGANWNASGVLSLGCAKYAGARNDFFRGAITDVKVWRGALTDAAAAAVKNANPPVSVQAWYPLEGPRAEEPTNLEDRSGNARHLSMASGEPHWEQDRFASRNGALGLALDEGSCAETNAPVIQANESFSVAAWVSLDDLTGDRTVLSQSGSVKHRFLIEYAAGVGRLRVVMTGGDSADAPTAEVRSLAAPAAGAWTHVAAVFNGLTNKLTFYVDGEPQGEGTTLTGSLWSGSSPLRVGCLALTGGTRSNYLGGIVDDVRVWTSTVDPDLFGTFAHA